MMPAQLWAGHRWINLPLGGDACFFETLVVGHVDQNDRVVIRDAEPEQLARAVSKSQGAGRQCGQWPGRQFGVGTGQSRVGTTSIGRDGVFFIQHPTHSPQPPTYVTGSRLGCARFGSLSKVGLTSTTTGGLVSTTKFATTPSDQGVPGLGSVTTAGVRV